MVGSHAQLGSITAGGKVIVVVNSPGATVDGETGELPIDGVLLEAINTHVTSCAELNVPYRSLHLVAALINLEQSFAAFCFNEARSAYDHKIRMVIDRFIARQLAEKGDMEYSPVDLSTDPFMVEAARIALTERAGKVDERHAFLAFLKSNAGFRDQIAKNLGNDEFALLENTALNRIPTSRPVGRTADILFD